MTTVTVTGSRCAPAAEAEKKGYHVFEIAGCSLRVLRVGDFLRSANFTVGGHVWSILVHPKAKGHRNEYSGPSGYASVGIELMSRSAGTVRASFTISLLLQNGGYNAPPTPRTFDFCHPKWRTLDSSFFVKQGQLGSSGYLFADSMTVKCTLTVVEEEPQVPYSIPSDDGDATIARHLGKLLEAKDAMDVTFQVKGEEFHAHKLVLAMRSPVFKAELYGPMKEKDMSSIVIEDMEPPVFKALLYFVYNDSVLPMDDVDGDDRKEIVRHLLVAADRYDMERLKRMCEGILCKGLDAECVANTLALADRHNCARLKDACVRFIAFSGKTDDMLESQGYAQLKRTHPSLLMGTWERTSKLRKV